MLRKVTLFTAIFFILAITAFLSSGFLLKTILESKLSNYCEGCSLHIERANVNWNSFILKEITFNTDDNHREKIIATISAVKFDLKYLDLLKGKTTIDRVTFDTADVEVREYLHREIESFKFKNLTNESDGSSKTTLSEIEFKNSKFTYSAEKNKRLSYFRTQNINGEIKLNNDITADLNGSIEDSGNFTLHVNLSTQNKETLTKIKIVITDHSLQTHKDFLLHNIKMQLQGKVIKLITSYQLAKGRLSGDLAVKYKGLKILVPQTQSRTLLDSKVNQLFMNFAAYNNSSQKFVTTKIHSRRKKTQSIFNFMLDALLPGLQRIIKRSQ